MKPSVDYVKSAAFFSFSMVALLGYPSAAIRSAPGVAPDDDLWRATILILGSALTAYSAFPKSEILLRLNWLVVSVVCIAVYLFCLALNPTAVLENTGWVIYFSIFSLGAPFWLPLAGLVWHAKSCANVKDEST